MNDFIWWNLIFLLAWCLMNIIRWSLPKGIVFSVVSVSLSQIHGKLAIVLINEDRVSVFKKGPLWRYQKTGKVLPDEWADILDSGV